MRDMSNSDGINCDDFAVDVKAFAACWPALRADVEFWAVYARAAIG